MGVGSGIGWEWELVADTLAEWLFLRFRFTIAISVALFVGSCVWIARLATPSRSGSCHLAVGSWSPRLAVGSLQFPVPSSQFAVGSPQLAVGSDRRRQFAVGRRSCCAVGKRNELN